ARAVTSVAVYDDEVGFALFGFELEQGAVEAARVVVTFELLEPGAAPVDVQRRVVIAAVRADQKTAVEGCHPTEENVLAARAATATGRVVRASTHRRAFGKSRPEFRAEIEVGHWTGETLFQRLALVVLTIGIAVAVVVDPVVAHFGHTRLGHGALVVLAVDPAVQVVVLAVGAVFDALVDVQHVLA